MENKLFELTKADWKLFREKLPGWQEAYMEKLTREYIALLQGKGNASNKFWALEKRIRSDKNKPGVIVELSKRETPRQIAALIRDGAITRDDLDGFSEELKWIVGKLV